jgi:hypothetical protein
VEEPGVDAATVVVESLPPPPVQAAVSSRPASAAPSCRVRGRLDLAIVVLPLSPATAGECFDAAPDRSVPILPAEPARPAR